MYQNNLKSFKSSQGCMKLMISLHEKMEEQLHAEKESLLMSMKQDITKHSSSQFLNTMNKDVSKVVRDVNLFDSSVKSYLDYLVEVIFAPVTDSPIIVGLDHFILPGETEEEGKRFAQDSSMDFLKIGKLFNISFSYCESVKIGHALHVTKRKF